MRITFGIIALIFILVMPFWVYLPFILIGLIIFPTYIEAIFLGLFIDTIYGDSAHNILTGFPLGALAALLVLLVVPLRNRLRLQT